MMDLLPLHAWATLLSQTTILLAVVAASLLFYGWLADRVVFESRGRVNAQAFEPVDLGITSVLAGLFFLLIVSNWRAANGPAEAEAALPGAAAMIVQVIVNTLVFFAVMLGILTSLSLRRVSWRTTFGLDRLWAGGVLARAILLLAFGLPLIGTALFASRFVLGIHGDDDAAAQQIVRFLAENRAAAARWVVAASAIVLAPIQEEFVFRGYLYGVLRRYAGVPAGIVINAGLFAGIHLHAPSFAGLFVLATCLTLAYEWTGSLFVPMAMHALFNTISLIDLLSGGSGQ